MKHWTHRKTVVCTTVTPRYAITPDLRLPCPADRSRALIVEIADRFSREKGCEVSMLDGVRVTWADGWALARTSVTEPLITLRFEAHTQPRLAEIKETVYSKVPALREIATGR